MTRKIVPFREWHSTWLKQHGDPKGGYIDLSYDMRVALEQSNSWTAFVGDDVVACGGTIEMWPERHLAWIQMNKTSAPNMLFITRAAQAALKNVQGRIEITVQYDFPAGHRWARMLGFSVETMYMMRYGPSGETHTGYVRFN